MELVISRIWAAVVALLIHRAVSQRNVFPEARRHPSPTSSPTARVLVIVPARNESTNVGRRFVVKFVRTSRRYENWPALKTGLSKNMIETFGGTTHLICTAAAAFVLSLAALAVPLIVASGCHRGVAPPSYGALDLAVVSSTTAFVLHLYGARFFQIPLWYGLLFPLGYSHDVVIAAESLILRIRGQVAWKGRLYQ